MSGPVSPFAAGARAAATALLSSFGMGSMLVRLPAPPSTNGDAEQVGLASPGFQDVVLAPVLVQETANITSVRIPAEVLETALGVSGARDVEAALRAAAFVMLGDRLLQLRSVESRSVADVEYLYRLLLDLPTLR